MPRGLTDTPLAGEPPALRADGWIAGPGFSASRAPARAPGLRPSHLGWGLPKGIQGKDAPTLGSWRLCVLSEAGVKHKQTPPAWTAALAKKAGEPPALRCPDNGGRTFLSADLGNAGRGLLPNGLSEWIFAKKSRPPVESASCSSRLRLGISCSRRWRGSRCCGSGWGFRGPAT